MKEALTEIRDMLGDKVNLMAGNVATLEAFNDLSDWGANMIRLVSAADLFAQQEYRPATVYQLFNLY